MEIIGYKAEHGYNVYMEILEIRLKVDQFVNTNKYNNNSNTVI